MSTFTFGAGVITTAAGTKTATATPALSALPICIVVHSQATLPTPAVTDDNAGGGGTYTEINHFWNATPAKYVSVWVRNSVITSATSTIFTDTISGDDGGGIDVLFLSSMGLTGSAAVRQSGGNGNGTAGATPSVTLGSPADRVNALFGILMGNSNPPGMTPRAGWTEVRDFGFGTPTAGIHSMAINDGETAAAIAWGSTHPTTFACMVVEFNCPPPLQPYPRVNPVPVTQPIPHRSPI